MLTHHSILLSTNGNPFGHQNSRSQSSNQRIWSVNLAKRTIIAVFLFVPVFCIPNYLSFAIIEEKTFTNNTIYKVS